MKKYELTTNTKEVGGKKLFQIKALIDFGDVKKGELGGFIEKEENLSHYGNAWVDGNARISGNAWIERKADYTIDEGFGTCHRATTSFRCKDGLVRMNCGCFHGTIEEFREQVMKTRDGKVAKEYLMLADLIEVHFAEEPDQKESREIEEE